MKIFQKFQNRKLKNLSKNFIYIKILIVVFALIINLLKGVNINAFFVKILFYVKIAFLQENMNMMLLLVNKKTGFFHLFQLLGVQANVKGGQSQLVRWYQHSISDDPSVSVCYKLLYQKQTNERRRRRREAHHPRKKGKFWWKINVEHALVFGVVDWPVNRIRLFSEKEKERKKKDLKQNSRPPSL